jgi:hypothetical protein
MTAKYRRNQDQQWSFAFEKDRSIPMLYFNFQPFSDIWRMEKNAMLDFIGIVGLINLSGTVTCKRY